VDPDQVGHAVFGNVLHTEKRDMYLSRVAAVNGGLAPALCMSSEAKYLALHPNQCLI
jgi:hypothetical protein